MTTLTPRRVLLLAHTLLSMRYVTAVAELLAGDRRVQLVWTQAPDAYGTGVVWELLAGVTVHGRHLPAIRLEAAAQQRWDLVLFGTHGSSSLFQSSPLVLVAHGLGGGKLVSAPEIGITRPQEYTYGPDWALTGGAPRYALMLEASHALRDLAVRHCPPLAPVIKVVGSLEADRLLASVPLRDRYRAAFGLADGQVGVLFISTFGRDSLLARHGTELLTAAAKLPAGMVPLVTCHPHVWAGRHDGHADGTSGGLHGGWPPRLASLAQDGRLIVCPPGADWIPYLIAADVAVIDHGSLGVYWSLLERPTIAVPALASRINPASPIAALHATVPQLTDPTALGALLQTAQEEFDPAAFTLWRKELIAYPGEAATRTRRVLYELLDLPVSAWPPPPSGSPSTHARAWQDAILPPTSTLLEPS